MEKLTAKQLIQIILDNDLQSALFDDDNYQLGYKAEDNGFGEDTVAFLKSLGLPISTVVDSRCDTAEMWSVIYFPVEDIYLKLTGTYDSYGQYEHDYDDEVTQVFPKQVTVTIYEENNGKENI
jgi:hypothetical protein